MVVDDEVVSVEGDEVGGSGVVVPGPELVVAVVVVIVVVVGHFDMVFVIVLPGTSVVT